LPEKFGLASRFSEASRQKQKGGAFHGPAFLFLASILATFLCLKQKPGDLILLS